MTKYKGYVGQFTVDTETGLIRGEVVNTRDVITFYGTTVPEAEQAFRDSVDDYLDFCKEQGDEPEKPYSGKFLLRLSPALHQELEVLAKSRGKSVNKLISSYLARMARRNQNHPSVSTRKSQSGQPGASQRVSYAAAAVTTKKASKKKASKKQKKQKMPAPTG